LLFLLVILGWRILDDSIRTALENTQLLGRSQFLKKEDTEALGLPGSMALLDGGLVPVVFSTI